MQPHNGRASVGPAGTKPDQHSCQKQHPWPTQLHADLLVLAPEVCSQWNLRSAVCVSLSLLGWSWALLGWFRATSSRTFWGLAVNPFSCSPSGLLSLQPSVQSYLSSAMMDLLTGTQLSAHTGTKGSWIRLTLQASLGQRDTMLPWLLWDGCPDGTMSFKVALLGSPPSREFSKNHPLFWMFLSFI